MGLSIHNFDYLSFDTLGLHQLTAWDPRTPCLMQTRCSCNSGMPFLKASSILHTKNTSGIIPHPLGCVKNIVQHQVMGRDIATTVTPLFHTPLDFSLHMHNNVSCYHITSETRRRWEHSEARKQNSSFMSWQKAERIVRPCSTARTQQQLRGTDVREYLCSVLQGGSGLQWEGKLGSVNVRIFVLRSLPPLCHSISLKQNRHDRMV